MQFVIPEKAIRMIPGNQRKTYSLWHLQVPNKMNKTICGKTIADGRGWKYRNQAWYKIKEMNKIKWEGKKIYDITKGKFCKTCLGAMTITKNKPIAMYIEDDADLFFD